MPPMNQIEATIDATLTRLYEVCATEERGNVHAFVAFKSMADLLNANEYTVADGVLARMDTERLSNVALLASVRICLGRRDHLPSWAGAVRRVADALTSRGKDPAPLMRDMLPIVGR